MAVWRWSNQWVAGCQKCSNWCFAPQLFLFVLTLVFIFVLVINYPVLCFLCLYWSLICIFCIKSMFLRLCVHWFAAVLILIQYLLNPCHYFFLMTIICLGCGSFSWTFDFHIFLCCVLIMLYYTLQSTIWFHFPPQWLLGISLILHTPNTSLYLARNVLFLLSFPSNLTY